MRIAQVAPLFESVPPARYGGTERVVSWLTEELVRQGHEVTLFASGDSETLATLVSPCDRALRLDGTCVDHTANHILMLEHVFQRAQEFDIIHFHLDYLHFPLSRAYGAPNVTTPHGRLDLPELVGVFKEFKDMPVVSISDAQREPMPWASWRATVHHGLPPGRFRLHDRPGTSLVFVGRISPEKRLDRAIAIAREVGMPLRIAAKVDARDRAYFTEVVQPLLGQPGIEYLGEIEEEDKERLLADAAALLFPIDWPEPFGIVMIEAMACGTPVIAFRHGSVPEIIEDHVSGRIITSLDEGARAVEDVLSLDRRRVRESFEARFTVERMARDYVAVYRDILKIPHLPLAEAS